MELGLSQAGARQTSSTCLQSKKDPQGPAEEVTVLAANIQQGPGDDCDTIEIDGDTLEVCRESNASVEEPGVIVLDGVEIPVVRSSSSSVVNVSR